MRRRRQMPVRIQINVNVPPFVPLCQQGGKRAQDVTTYRLHSSGDADQCRDISPRSRSRERSMALKLNGPWTAWSSQGCRGVHCSGSRVQSRPLASSSLPRHWPA
jgi:hypothetical protein